MSSDSVELLVKALTHKFSTTLNFVSTSSRFTEIFKVPINLNRDYNFEIGLLWFFVYNSIFNVPLWETFIIIQDKYIKYHEYFRLEHIIQQIFSVR